jgi:hypothetical protein
MPGWGTSPAGLHALRGARAALGVLKRGGHGREVGGGKRGLDERKELTLLEPDVVGEAAAELVQDGRVGRRVDGERVGTRADVNVVAERSGDERVVGITVVRIRGQQDLFLEPKMRAAVLLPVVHERRAPVARGVGRRAFERAGDVERQMVVVRKRDEGGVALHRPQVWAWPARVARAARVPARTAARAAMLVAGGVVTTTCRTPPPLRRARPLRRPARRAAR